MVLILTGLITAMVIQAQFSAHMTLRYENSKVVQSQLRTAAGDAAWQALHMLANDSNLLVDHTNEPWAVSMDSVLSNGISTTVRVIDENRFFDVNNVSSISQSQSARPPIAIIEEILVFAEQPDPHFAAEILKDWIDTDREGPREAHYYRNRDAFFEIANAPMESPQELLAILSPGDSENRLLQYLAVIPRRRTGIVPVDVNTAGRDVLTAIYGPNQALTAESICRRRDAHPFSLQVELMQLMNANTFKQVKNYLDTRSTFFSVCAEATNGSRAERIYCLVSRDAQGRIDILRWVFQ